jgi:predicted amino acid dehydrogenase
VGATGAIGSVCAQMLAGQVAKIVLIGRRQDKLQEVAEKIRSEYSTEVVITAEINELRQASLIITVTSAVDAIIEPQYLQRGAIICDVARPRDVSIQVAQQRPDVLVIEGGMVAVPGDVNFGFNFGFPPQMAYACMAETMALALEQRYESFTLGKDIELSQVLTIDRIAQKHGFKLGGFRSFERAITDDEIAKIKANSRLSDITNHQTKVNSQQNVGSVPL